MRFLGSYQGRCRDDSLRGGKPYRELDASYAVRPC